MSKVHLKKQAVKLRGRGLSYSEILSKVSVSKSTLSLWLRSVGLTKTQKQSLTKKKLAGMKRGWQARRRQRLKKTAQIKQEACSEIKRLSSRELWLIGIALYWAEGSKQKEHNPSERVAFSNSDPLMIKFFLNWLLYILKIKNSEIIYEIYLHRSQQEIISEVKTYWSEMLRIPEEDFRVYYKRNRVKNKKRLRKNYRGLIRIKVRKSADFNRKITGWTEGILKNCGVV